MVEVVKFESMKQRILDAQFNKEAVNVRHLSMECCGPDSFYMQFGDKQKFIGKKAMSSFEKVLDASGLHRYGDSPDVFNKVFEYHKEKSDEDSMFVFSSGNIVHDVSINDRPLVSDILPILEEVVNPEQVSISRFDTDGVNFSIITGRVQDGREIRKNDISNVGINIVSDSKGLNIYPYVFRYVCSNGLSVMEPIVFEVENSDVRGLVSSCYKKSLDLLDAFCKSDSRLVENPEAFLSRMVREKNLSSSAFSKLVSLVPSLPNPIKAYDIVNLITSFAKDFDNADKHSLLIRGAGTFMVNDLNHNVHRCAVCDSAL